MGRVLGTAAFTFCILALSACNPFESKLISACEEVLKGRLKAPSTYKRIRISERESVMTQGDFISWRDEYIRAETSPAVRQAMQRMREDDLKRMVNGEIQPKVFKLSIEYDASNAFGTPIRGLSECEFRSREGNKREARPIAVTLDGKSMADYLSDLIKAARQ